MPTKKTLLSETENYFVREEFFLVKKAETDNLVTTLELCSGPTTFLDILQSSCTITAKYNSIISLIKISINSLITTGILNANYVAIRCYNPIIAPTSTIYDCLNGIRYHFSDIRQVPDQDNPWTLARPLYYFPSMAEYDSNNQVTKYLSERGKDAWIDFLHDLDGSHFNKDQIASLVGLSILYILYKPDCKMKEYFDQYIKDATVSYGARADMARISLIVNAYFLDQDTSNNIVAHSTYFTTASDKDIYLKYLLTLGTSLQGKPWLGEFYSTMNRLDFKAAINSLNSDPKPNQALVADLETLLLDFTFADDPQF